MLNFTKVDIFKMWITIILNQNSKIILNIVVAFKDNKILKKVLSNDNPEKKNQIRN